MADKRPPMGSDGEDVERLCRIDDLLLEVAQRRLRGEIVSADEILEAHPNLMPELGEQLRMLAELSPEAESELPAVKHVGVLNIRCPHCRHPAEVCADTPASDITCQDCGSHFSLVDDIEEPPNERTRKLGHFKLIEPLGAGSFGTVWKARDLELERDVAVKIPRHGQLDLLDVERFLREARAAAPLNHPNIAGVHEVGREGGMIYIVSDLIPGVSLSNWLSEQPPSFAEAAEMTCKIADALHHAHQAGIVHRDVKPDNIIIDSDREPHLTDFGMARRDAGEVTMTIDGRVLGTPAYMSPEQARGEAHKSDHRTDIYSLGVVLFELVTGELPFRGSIQMMIHQVLHEEPPSPRKLNIKIPRDIETICLRCLEKDPAKRYRSAEQVAQELHRYLQGKPIEARPISCLTRSGRWCRRNPVLSAAASIAMLLALALAVGGPVVAWQQARLAEKNRRQLYVSDMGAAMEASRRGEWSRVELLLGHHVPSASQADLRRFEWYMLWNRWKRSRNIPSFDMGSPVQTVSSLGDQKLLVAHNMGLTQLDLDTKTRRVVSTEKWLRASASTKNPNHVVSASIDGFLRFHQLERGTVKVWENRKDLVEFWRFSFSADGKRLAATVWANSAGTNWMDVWDVHSGQKSLPELTKDGHGFWDVCFSPDGRVIASAGWDSRSICLWDALNGNQIGDLQVSGPVGCVRFSPDGRFLVAGGGDRYLRVWRASDDFYLAYEKEAHESRITSIAFSADGQTMASVGRDSIVKLWQLSSKGRIDLLDEFYGHDGAVNNVCFLEDGRIASGGQDGRVLIWNPERNPNREVLRGHTHLVRAVDISPDGRYVASGGHDYLLHIWDLEQDLSYKLAGHTGTIRALAYSPDGQSIVTGGWDRRVILWDASGRKELRRFRHEFPVWNVWFSRTGDLAIALGLGVGGGRYEKEKKVLAWQVDSGQRVPNEAVGAKNLVDPAWTLQERNLRLVRENGKVTLFDLTRKRNLWVAKADNHFVFRFFPLGAQTIACNDGNTIRLLDLQTGEERARLTGHMNQIWDLAVSQDGRTLVSASEDQTVRVWRAASPVDVSDAGW